MHLCRSRNPHRSPSWRSAHRHFAEFVENYPQDCQSHLGPVRLVIPQFVRKFLHCGALDWGFAKSGT